jgi:uncharacterized surface protein with fasciclin (FAS1) repeats
MPIPLLLRAVALLLLTITVVTPTSQAMESLYETEKHNSLADLVRDDQRFTTLVTALEATGLDETLDGHDSFTLFAPTNSAFDALPAGVLATLLRPENRSMLVEVLTAHVVPGTIMAHDLLSSGSAKTVNGKALPIGLSVGGSTVIETDLAARNGVVHVIDAVIVPRSIARGLAAASMPTTATGATSMQAVINEAIRLGAPLYNAGQIQACEAIYTIAALALRDRPDMPDRVRRMLDSALMEAGRTESASDGAWRLREGLDGAYRALGRMTMSTSAGH